MVGMPRRCGRWDATGPHPGSGWPRTDDGGGDREVGRAGRLGRWRSWPPGRGWHRLPGFPPLGGACHVYQVFSAQVTRPPPPWSRTHSVSRRPWCGPSAGLVAAAGEIHSGVRASTTTRTVTSGGGRSGSPLAAIFSFERPGVPAGWGWPGRGRGGPSASRLAAVGPPRGASGSRAGPHRQSSTGRASESEWRGHRSRWVGRDVVARRATVRLGAAIRPRPPDRSVAFELVSRTRSPDEIVRHRPAWHGRPRRPGRPRRARRAAEWPGQSATDGRQAGRASMAYRVGSRPDGRMRGGVRDGGHRTAGPGRAAQARLSGAIRSRSFLRPTEVKITTASASSPVPPRLDHRALAPLAVDHHVAGLEAEQLGAGGAGARRRRPVASKLAPAPARPRCRTRTVPACPRVPRPVDRPGPAHRADPDRPAEQPRSTAHLADQLGRDLVEETARDVGAGAAPKTSGSRRGRRRGGARPG